MVFQTNSLSCYKRSGGIYRKTKNTNIVSQKIQNLDPQPSKKLISKNFNRRKFFELLGYFSSLNLNILNPAESASLFQDDPLYEKDTNSRKNKLIDPKIAAAFTGSVYNGVQDSGCGLTEEQFQKQLFKLRDREYKYYFEMKKDQLPRIPDLSDMSGGLSNPAYFNFLSYIAWKVVAGQIRDPQIRNQIVQLSGINLINQIAPDIINNIHTYNNNSTTMQNVSYDNNVNSVINTNNSSINNITQNDDNTSNINALQGNYANNINALKGNKQISVEQMQIFINQLLTKLINSGYALQFKITWGYLPGSFSGDWYLNPDPEKYGTSNEQFNQFQIRIHRPADIEASVALREEDDGFWGASVSSMDAWRAPPSSWDKVKLMFGDPLETSYVPWEPQTLVQNWTLEV